MVTATRTYDEPPVFDYNNYSLIPPNSGGGVIGSSGGNGNTGSGFAGGTMLSSGSAGATTLDIVSAMIGSLGLSATFASSSAIALKLETQAAFTTTSRIFGVLDVLTNIYEIAFSEEDMNHKLEDGAQALVGIALAFVVTNPVGLVVGGIALAAWEIYEYDRDHTPILEE